MSNNLTNNLNNNNNAQTQKSAFYKNSNKLEDNSIQIYEHKGRSNNNERQTPIKNIMSDSMLSSDNESNLQNINRENL